ncbi:MAG: folylpolyglutamate synthase/dihydrofolate synthase family protein [Desulfonatronovibrio sp.]
MDLGLDRLKKAIESSIEFSRKPPIVQIVGTNGKGSTACFLEALSRSHGLKTGLYTSPHLTSIKERIRINFKILSDNLWLESANDLFTTFHENRLTYFEVLTLMAVQIFEKHAVDIVILEAGLGGRYDATTAFSTVFNVFTPVGLDHTNILGSSLEEIVRDKSMAMRGSPSVISRQEIKAMEILKGRARDLKSDIYIVDDYFYFGADSFKFKSNHDLELNQSELGLKGFYQMENAATALLTWEIFARKMGHDFDDKICARALKDSFWPGRMHTVQEKPLIILDGAHNEQALLCLKNALEKTGLNLKTVIFACLADKNVKELCGIVKQLKAERIFATDIKNNHRAMPGEDMVSLLGPDALYLSDVNAFLSDLKEGDGPVLVCGSLYLLGMVYEAFPEWLVR